MLSECLGAGNHLINRPDPNFTSTEFNHNIATVIETDSLTKLGGQADTPRF